MSTPAPYIVRARNIDPAADNKIHDDDVARRFGFSGALVPGVELFAYLTHPLVGHWGEQWLTGGGLDVRFRRPVYDGEDVRVRSAPAADGSHTVTLSAGTVRALGQAYPPRPVDAVDVSAFPRVALPAEPPPAGPDTLRPGALGTVEEIVDERRNAWYLQAVGEPAPLYAAKGIIHPGLLLRLVNAVLFRNVTVGPWIHVASRCRLLTPARVGGRLAARAVVTDVYERNGNDPVRYDALVLRGDVPVMRVDHTAIYALRR